MTFDMMGITGATLPAYEPIEWIKVLIEIFQKVYSLFMKNLSSSLKHRKRNCDLRSSYKIYDRGAFVYKLDFRIKTGAKSLFPVWQHPYLIIQGTHPSIRSKKGKAN